MFITRTLVSSSLDSLSAPMTLGRDGDQDAEDRDDDHDLEQR